MRMFRTALVAAGLSLLLSACPSARDAAPPLRHEPTEVPRGAESIANSIDYTLRFDDAKGHYVHVRAVYPASSHKDVELRMAVWTPGSYLVREYGRHIEDLRFASASGEALEAEKVSKNRWRVRTVDAGLVAEYRLYCRELSVRTNFVDADVAILNGAPTFLTLVEDQARAHTVALHLPEGWQGASTALAPGPAKNQFRAASYDELVDSPIIAGRELHTSQFAIRGVPHTLSHLGDTSAWSLEDTRADVEQLAATVARFWGVVPYEGYHFLNVVLGGGGGLEHLDSTLMMASPMTGRRSERYHNWLGLVAHEFFHTWNVKRLRPAGLGPFDYEAENYTHSLWVAEGITSYYDDLLLRRAGLIDESDYLRRLSEQIRQVQETPGRLVQSLSQASYDAWIKHYRRDENSRNTSISYYTKGAVVAFLLDTEIRIASGGTRSLDDLMRLMYDRYSGDRGYTPEDFRKAASDVAGASLDEFFEQSVDTAGELNYQRALDHYGLTLADADEGAGDGGGAEAPSEETDDDPPPGWLGADMSGERVIAVKRGTPAYAAGMNVDDELLAINGYRSHDLGSLLHRFDPGSEVTLTISRRGRLRELVATLGKAPSKRWQLQPAMDRSLLQAERYREWLAETD